MTSDSEDRIDEIEVITRYEKGQPDTYSVDGGKTFMTKAEYQKHSSQSEAPSVDGWLLELLRDYSGMDFCEADECSSWQACKEFMGHVDAKINRLIAKQVVEARLDELTSLDNRRQHPVRNWGEVTDIDGKKHTLIETRRYDWEKTIENRIKELTEQLGEK